MLDALKPYKLAIEIGLLVAAVLGLFAAVHQYNSWQQGIGEARIQAQWDKSIADAKERANNETKSLQDKQDARIQTAITALQDATARADGIAASVRNRPERPSANLPTSAGAPVGHTGAELSRPDAEFLVGLAADAERTRIALDTCKRAYEGARQALNTQPPKE